MTLKNRARVATAMICLAGPLSASAADLDAGDPIVAERIVDHMEVRRVVDAIDAAVDARNWPIARRQFADSVAVDFTSLTGGAPSVVAADALIAGWAANLTAEKTSFHLRGNHRVTFDGPDRAVVRSHGYAWNRLERGAASENGGDPLWEVWGTYEHALARIAGEWRVDAMTFAMTAERGDAYVRDTPGR